MSDLDDTETYFEKAWTATSQIVGGRTGYYTKAWDGFSSDEVYLRMRVEGNYSTPIQTLITKIGNHELKPKFESLLPETTIEDKSNGYYTFNGNSAPYYDAPSFEETLKTLDSYYKATDKLTWTDGINVTFDKSDVFNYGELIDLSELGATTKLFTILIKPTGAATTLLYVDLIDENDPENILSVRFVCTKTSDTDYRTLVTASALKTGLPYTGYWAANNALHLDRNNGGFYTSVDISGLNTALYYPLSFAYDETTKQVLSCIADRSQLGIVADMDDTTTEFSNVWYGSTQLKNPNDATKYYGYVQKAWSGFSSNKVYLRVRTDGSYEQPLETCITRIGAENLAITGKAKPFFVDNDTIEIDVGGYDYNNLPNAIVGSPYNLFESVGYDITGKELPITTKIYYGNTEVQIAHNGVSFIPPKAGKYTIVYSATDRYGYVTTKEYIVIAVTEISENLKPVIETETNEVNAITGWAIKLPSYEVRNGIGSLSVNIQILHKGNIVKEFLQDEELVFTPIANGEYVVNYVVRDYVGNTSTASVTIFAEANGDPVFQGDVELPSVMVAGWSYKLPDLYAIDYYVNESQPIKAKITAYDNRGEFVVENGEYSPKVNESKLVKIVYSVQTENGYAEKEYTVQVQKTSDGNGLNVSEYFIGENVDIASTKTAVRVKAKQTGASFRFINPILIGKNGLTLVFNIPTTANNFKALTIYLTDVENEKNTIKYTLYKGDSNNKEDMSFTTLLINDEDTAYRVPGSFLSGASYELTYEELYRRITATSGASAPVNKTVYGEPFEGFAGRFVYVTFEFGEKVEGDAYLDITKINNQALNSTITDDIMAPQIAVLGEYGGMAEINTETTIMRAVAGDILAENVTVTVTVTDPKGLKNIISIDGVALKGADASKEYCFIPTQYGAYRVTFTAEDCNGKSATMSYNITVVDNKGPTISLDGEIPAEIILEDGKAVLRIPNITVTDESGKECRVVINLKRPDGTMVRLEETEVLISASGKYVLYIDAYDSSNNLTIKTFVIIVR